ncbi:MAG: YicC/YloC family endoribonuclease [Desulfomonilaceae bacterium]
MQAGGTGVANGGIRSMTGFGRGRDSVGNVEIATEVRSVNHRFLDISLRVPRIYSGFEPEIRKIVAQSVDRGKFDVVINRTGGKGGLMDVMVDQSLAEGYYKCLLQLKEKFGLPGEISLSEMLTLKEIVVPLEREEGIEQEWPTVENSLRQALSALDEMRKAEGSALWRDIEARLIAIRDMVGSIRPIVNQVTVAAKEKLEKRVQELTGGVELDRDRILQEVAIIADRSDVTEELTRLESHVRQFVDFGAEGSPLGRKLDFLLQELHREVNTLGSKSASTDVATYVVNIKAELEKIREQTQNIE